MRTRFLKLWHAGSIAAIAACAMAIVSHSQPNLKSSSESAPARMRANSTVQPVGTDPTETIVSYFKGREEDWKKGVATHGSVTYKDL